MRQTQTDDLACGKLINCNAKREHDGIGHKERGALAHQQAVKTKEPPCCHYTVSESAFRRKTESDVCLAVKNNERYATPENSFCRAVHSTERCSFSPTLWSREKSQEEAGG